MHKTAYLFIVLSCFACDNDADPAKGTPDAARWQKLTLNFTGPDTHEQDSINPFRTYRLDVAFINGNERLVVPGFYAADGRAAETGAASGNVWQVRFRPPAEGQWQYAARFTGAEDLARYDREGTVLVGPPAPADPGRLQRTHPRYLQWSGSGDYFLKAGPNSPENLLAYADFDGTYRHSENFREGESKTEGLHTYAPHERDYAGGRTWRGRRGRGLFGALSYLAGTGVNGIYFLTMNINGDGKDVFPFVAHDSLDRYDVSKLDQWERIFDHADSLGMMLNMVLQETENESLLDGGDTGPLRQLYFRELIARFGHHRALTWNLGEENGPNNWSDNPQDNEQQRAMADYFEAHDPYHNHTVLHTHSNPKETAEIMDPLLGDPALDGLSLQLHHPYEAYDVVRRWIAKSEAAGQPWLVTLDEAGPWYRGLDPDAGYGVDVSLNNQDSMRALALWGTLMAGGGGGEWYSGAFQQTNDLNTEDFRTRDRAWRWSGYALNFFRDHLPFQDMRPDTTLAANPDVMVLAGEDGPYALYFPFGGSTPLNLGETEGMNVRWYNPREGGALTAPEPLEGSTLTCPGEGDWAAILR